jgi:hypothetical protein
MVRQLALRKKPKERHERKVAREEHCTRIATASQVEGQVGHRQDQNEKSKLGKREIPLSQACTRNRAE